MIDQHQHTTREMDTAMSDSHGDLPPYLELLTERELALFLQIDEISNSKDHHNVIEHLKRYGALPRIRICNKVLYPTRAIRRWIEKETVNNN